MHTDLEQQLPAFASALDRDAPTISIGEIVGRETVHVDVEPFTSRPRGRQLWPSPVLGVAAALIAVLVVGLVALSRTRDEQPTPAATLPTEPLPATSGPPDTVLGPTEPTVTTHLPTTTPSQPVEPTVIEQQVRLSDVVTDVDPPAAEDVYQFPAGLLGYEDCGECDPVTPWGPVITDDGRIVVADEVNRQWVTTDHDGARQMTPYPEGVRFISPPEVGPDGRIYIVDGNFAAGDEHTTPARLLAFAVDDLATPLTDVEVRRVVSSQVWFDGSAVMVNGSRAEVDLTPAAPVLPTVEWRRNIPQEIVVTWNGVRRTWTIESAQGVGAATTPSGALPDGSVLIVDIGTRDRIRLLPDGTAVRFQLPEGGGYNGSEQVSATELVQLEGSPVGPVLRRYRLPGFTPPAADPASVCAGPTEQAPIVADLDGDGRDEHVYSVGAPGTDESGSATTFYTIVACGTDVVIESAVFESANKPVGVAAVDTDGDGRDELWLIGYTLDAAIASLYRWDDGALVQLTGSHDIGARGGFDCVEVEGTVQPVFYEFEFVGGDLDSDAERVELVGRLDDGPVVDRQTFDAPGISEQLAPFRDLTC